MSYTKYKTQGIVIGGSNIGESSRNYNVFTRDFGLIRVSAQGIRELGSKLKYHLQNLYLTDLILIKGKNGWRITESYKIKNFSLLFGQNKSKLQASTKILLFLKRMLPEEDSNKELFDIITEGLSFMEKNTLDNEEVSSLETLMVLRALRNLGYVKKNLKMEALLSEMIYDRKTLLQTGSIKSFVVAEINQSIKMSEL